MAWERRQGFPARCTAGALLSASPLLSSTRDDKHHVGDHQAALAKGWGETVVNARSVLRVAGTL